MTFENLTAMEKLTRAKIQLGYNKPFWSYLVMHGKYIQDESATETIGVDKNGTVYFNEEFINTLTESEVEGVICHEIFHVAFKHLSRLSDLTGTDKETWNIAADIVVNNELWNEGFKLPEGGINPRYGNVEVNGVEIEKIADKTVERIYTELSTKKMNPEDGDKGFDDHKDKGDEKDSQKEQKKSGSSKQKNKSSDKKEQFQELETEQGKTNWDEKLVEAATYAKQKGQLSKGIERMLGDLLNPEINWRSKLYKYITNSIPHDYTYSRPSKKSLASGFYMPSPLKENIDVIVGIDTSGSIRQKDFDSYITEIISMARSFENINITLVTWDTEVREIHKVDNSNIEKIKTIDISGGGGTDVNTYFKTIKEKFGNPKLVVTLTDGFFGEITEDLNSSKLWVLNGHSTDRNIKDGEIY